MIAQIKAYSMPIKNWIPFCQKIDFVNYLEKVQCVGLKHIYMGFICQNFNSNGPTGKKFDVFPSTAFKRTALQPLKIVKPFFDTLLVLEEIW